MDRTMRSGDIPTAPPILQWRPVIDTFEECAGHKRRAVSLRIYRRHHHPVRRPVAIQTFAEAPLEARRLGFCRVERVVNQALNRIRRDEFEHLPILDGTDSSTVIEEKRARSLRR